MADDPQEKDAALPAEHPHRVAKRIALGGLALAAAAGLVLALGPVIADPLRAFARWVEGVGPAGPIVFVSAYALLTVALVPGVILTLAAGAVFGIGPGAAYVFTGATLGAMGAFVVSRRLARRAVERALARSSRFQAVDRAVAAEGLKMVLLLRLSPIVPFNVLNYALGLTGIPWHANLIGCAGMIRGTLLYVYSGRVAGEAALAAGSGEAALDKGPAYWAVLAAGLAATVVVSVLLARVARRAIREQGAGAAAGS